MTNADEERSGAKYEVFDHVGGRICGGDFVVGWARKPSEGLVGIARHDGEVGASHIIEYLQKVPTGESLSIAEFEQALREKEIVFVPKSDLPWLTAAEQQEAQRRGLSRYFFPDDTAMLAAIARAKAEAGERVSPATA